MAMTRSPVNAPAPRAPGVAPGAEMAVAAGAGEGSAGARFGTVGVAEAVGPGVSPAGGVGAARWHRVGGRATGGDPGWRWRRPPA